MLSTDILNLQEEIGKSGRDLLAWYSRQNDDQFNEEIVPKKWTSAQHLVHLTKSVKGVRKGLEMTPETLQKAFGNLKRDEWSYQELATNYKRVLDNGAVAPANMSPSSVSNFIKDETISKFEDETSKLVEGIGKWNNDNISKFGLPHPRMGLLSIREMLMFCVLHNLHHLKSLRQNYSS